MSCLRERLRLSVVEACVSALWKVRFWEEETYRLDTHQKGLSIGWRRSMNEHFNVNGTLMLCALCKTA
jgi:hypothetical protein